MLEGFRNTKLKSHPKQHRVYWKTIWKSETATPLLRNIWRRSGENSIKYSSPSIPRPSRSPPRTEESSSPTAEKTNPRSRPFLSTQRLDLYRCCCFNLSNNYFRDILQMCILLLSISSLLLSCSDPPLHQKLDFQREIRRRGSLILPLLPFCLQIGFSDETLSFFFSLQCTNLIFQPSAFLMKRRQKRRLIWPE